MSDPRGLSELREELARTRELYDVVNGSYMDASAEAARYREALERITAAHVAGASAGELADRARGVLRGGGGHDD